MKQQTIISKLEYMNESKQAEKQSEAYWKYLIDYHKQWDCFPWEGVSPSNGTIGTFRFLTGPKSKRTKSYIQARETLRRDESTARTISFRKLFLKRAKAIGQQPVWFELMLSHPETTLSIFHTKTASELRELINSQKRVVPISEERIRTMSTGDLLRIMVKVGIITMSCGITAKVVQDVLSGNPNLTPGTCKRKAIIDQILIADRRASKKRRHHYLRIEGGEHAFVIEIFGGYCRIYQSFLGHSSLTGDMSRNVSFEITRFTSLLKRAMEPNPEVGTIPPDVEAVRRKLFGCPAYKPNDSFQVTEFRQEPEAEKRLDRTHRQMSAQWQPILKSPAIIHMRT